MWRKKTKRSRWEIELSDLSREESEEVVVEGSTGSLGLHKNVLEIGKPTDFLAVCEASAVNDGIPQPVNLSSGTWNAAVDPEMANLSCLHSFRHGKPVLQQ